MLPRSPATSGRCGVLRARVPVLVALLVGAVLLQGLVLYPLQIDAEIRAGSILNQIVSSPHSPLLGSSFSLPFCCGGRMGPGCCPVFATSTRLLCRGGDLAHVSDAASAFALLPLPSRS